MALHRIDKLYHGHISAKKTGPSFVSGLSRKKGVIFEVWIIHFPWSGRVLFSFVGLLQILPTSYQNGQQCPNIWQKTSKNIISISIARQLDYSWKLYGNWELPSEVLPKVQAISIKQFLWLLFHVPLVNSIEEFVISSNTI